MRNVYKMCLLFMANIWKIIVGRKSLLIEAISLSMGICLFIAPFLKIQSIYGESSQSENGLNKLHIRLDYSDCKNPNEPLLTLRKIPKTKNVEVTLDFINWRSFEVNCNQMIIDSPFKTSDIEHSKQIDGVTTSSLWPIDRSATTWDMLEKHTYIDVNNKTAPSFSGRIKFVLLDSIFPDKTGYMLASSFGVSGKSLKKELPFFKFVNVILEPNVKIDFTVPSIHAIDLNKWNMELTFEVNNGMETDIFTDVMVSVIDLPSMAER